MEHRWLLIPVFFGLLYLTLTLGYLINFYNTEYKWVQKIPQDIASMPLHIGLFILAMIVYGIGWFKKDRWICSVYFPIMIVGLTVNQLFYPLQFIMGIVILLGMIKIRKINGGE
jgi:hypothetical protein